MGLMNVGSECEEVEGTDCEDAGSDSNMLCVLSVCS